MMILHQNPKRNLVYLAALVLGLIGFFLLRKMDFAFFSGSAYALFFDPLLLLLIFVAIYIGVRIDALLVAVVTGGVYVLLNSNIHHIWVLGWVAATCDTLLVTTIASLVWTRVRNVKSKLA